jgi:outer membrane lipoprotein-sorting protein
MKEHKFILSALISLMLCFSFSIEVVAQANIKDAYKSLRGYKGENERAKSPSHDGPCL